MILGIDPGIANVGWAVISSSKFKVKSLKLEIEEIGTGGGDFWLAGSGWIRTDIKTESGERLKKIYDEIVEIAGKYKVEIMAVEKVYFAKNVKSALKVAEAIGVIKLAAAEGGIRLREYTPLQIKMALVGYGRAEKSQVEAMVRQELNIMEEIKIGHVSDAAAAALCAGFVEAI